MATLHPVFAMHGLPQFWASIYGAVQRAQRFAQRETGPTLPPASAFLLNPTPDDVAAYAADATFLSVDVETPRDDRHTIDLCGFSKDGVGACVFPWRGEYLEVAREVLERPSLTTVGHNFAFDDIAFRANGMRLGGRVYDTIQACALLWPPFREARKRRWSALTTCCTRVLDVPFWKHPEDPTTAAFYAASWPEVPTWQHPRLYCGLDCIYTHQLWGQVRRLLEAEGMWYLYAEIVAPAALVLIDMEERGFPVEVAERDHLKVEAETKKEELDAAIRDFTQGYHRQRITLVEEALQALEKGRAEATARPVRGAEACTDHPNYRGIIKRAACSACAAIYASESLRRAELSTLRKRITKGKGVLKRIGPAFQSTNDNHWRWLLFDKGGLALKPVERTAKKKEPKVDDYTIEVLQARHPDVPVLEWRVQMQELKHRLTTILGIPLREDTEGVWRAHFAYSQHLTENQRVASGLDVQEDDKQRDSPGNAQNIKDADRRIFVASAPDRCLVHYDWKQVELYRTAWLADDWDLLEAIWAGADIHSLNAAAICGCRPEDARTHKVRIGGRVENARQAYKFVTHAMDYYLTETSHHWRKIGLDRTEARRIRSGYFKLWKHIQPWQERQIEVASTKRCLVNAFGYKLRFFAFGRNRDGAWRVTDPAVAVAFAPASEVAFMAKAVLPALNDVRVGDSHLLTMTHDSFTFDVRKEAVAEHAAAVRPILTREWPEFGERAGRRFAAGVDVSVGRNWGKRTPINPDGLEDLT